MQNGKTRSTAIISLPTQALQHEVVIHGIVMESQIYDARTTTVAFKSNNVSTANSGAIHNQHVGSKHDVENVQAPTRQKNAQKRGCHV